MRQVVLPFLSVSLRDFYHSASTTMIQQENLKKRLARLAAPIFIETLLIMMLGAVDTVMLSRHSDNSVAAVGVVNQIIMLTFLVFEVINLGTSVLCSQYLGARLHKQVVQVVGVSLLVNFAVGVGISMLLFGCAEPILRLMGLGPELMQDGMDYMRIVGAFAFFQALSLTLSASLRSANKAVYPMLVTVVVNVLNIIGNYSLIFGRFGFPELGVEGAAISTAFSRGVSMVILFVILFRKHIHRFPPAYFRQKAQIPGFRKGMVPMSLVKKMYGKSVLAEEVNKLLSDSVYKYIQDNKVNILGEPLPNEDKQKAIDFDTMEEFEFLFDIALAPEFKAEVAADDKVDYYTIDVTEEMVDNQVKAYTQRNGKYEKVDAYADNDMLKGLLAELDAEGNTKEGGVQVEGAVMMPAYMKNDDQKAIFANAKVNDVLVFNPYTAWDGNAAELSSLLKVDKEAAAEMKSNFSFQVEEITRFVAGELNQEIFDQVFGEGVVKTEEEFRAKVKEVIANQFVADSDYKFLLDIRKMLMEKVGKLEFPDALLKRIMRLNNQDKDEKFVEDNYDKSIEELTWHLIKEQLVKANDIKVEQDDILNMAKETTRAQFAQYGMLSVPEEILDNYAKEMLKKKESIEGLVNRVVETKLASALKTQVTLENKNISAADFNKMFE